MIFFAVLGFISIVVVPSWMMLVHEFDTHPFLWYEIHWNFEFSLLKILVFLLTLISLYKNC